MALCLIAALGILTLLVVFLQPAVAPSSSGMTWHFCRRQSFHHFCRHSDGWFELEQNSLRDQRRSEYFLLIVLSTLAICKSEIRWGARCFENTIQSTIRRSHSVYAASQSLIAGLEKLTFQLISKQTAHWELIVQFRDQSSMRVV